MVQQPPKIIKVVNPGEEDESVNRRRLIQAIKMLPPAPFILTQILGCIDDPKSSAEDLKKVILEDQAITAKILNLANSAYYGYSQRVTDITRAIVIVGFNTVLETTLGISVMGILGKDVQSKELNVIEFWKYSFASAEAARIIASYIKYERIELAYIIGLLHDLGKLALLQCFNVEYDDVLFFSRAEDTWLAEKEQQTFEFDHTDAGMWLADKWKLPAEIIAPINLHHRLETLPKENVIELGISHICEYLVRTAGIGDNGEVKPAFLHRNILSFLRLKKDSISELKTRFQKEREKLEVIFSTLL